MSSPRRLRLAALAAVALLPNAVKPAIYRHVFGYRIGRHVRIGFSLIDARDCEIGSHTTIGHGNAVLNVGRLVIGEHVRIGTLNVLRGGDEIRLGPWTEVIRRNELNSIVDSDTVNVRDPRLLVGAGCLITDGHRLDFTDRIELGVRVIVGGRNSSLWTHNRQRTAPISVGDLTYLGSEIRMAPGSTLPSRSILALGSVVTGKIEGDESIIGGVPAKVLRKLDEVSRALVERRTKGLPDDL